MNSTKCLITETLDGESALININWRNPVCGKFKAQFRPYRLWCSRTYVQLLACMFVYVTFSAA